MPAIAFEHEDIVRVQELGNVGYTALECSISSLARTGTRFARGSSRTWTTSGSRWSSGIPSRWCASTSVEDSGDCEH
jgi:hypothetical protein